MESTIKPPIEEDATTRERETTIQEDHHNTQIQSKAILSKPGETPPEKSYSDQDQ